MKTFYKISDFWIECDHQNDPLFTLLDEEFAPYKSTAGTALGLFQIRRTSELPAIPSKAVLTGKWHSPERKEYEIHNCKYWVLGDNAILARDHKQRQVSVYYRKNTKELEAEARIALKWLIIKIAEETGHGYVHGAALNFQGKNILFAGDSGAGKSSCLLRVRKAGGRIISDDALLLLKNRPVPFTLKISVRSDYEKRFGIDLPSRGLARVSLAVSEGMNFLVSPEENLSGIDLIIFPKIWNNPQSRSSALNARDASRRLEQIYYKETLWNAYPAAEEQLLAHYTPLIANAKCFEFFAGPEESEVRDSLLKLIREGLSL